MPGEVCSFPPLDGVLLGAAGEADANGPLACGCYRIEVIDLGHGCGLYPVEHPALRSFGTKEDTDG